MDALTSGTIFAPGESSPLTWFKELDAKEAWCVDDVLGFDWNSWVPRSLAFDVGCLDSFAGRD